MTIAKPRTWQTAYNEMKDQRDQAVARNNELADELEMVKRERAALEISTRGLQTGNRDTRQANDALETALRLSRNQHRKDLGLIRDGKLAASQALTALEADRAQGQGAHTTRVTRQAPPGDTDPSVERVFETMKVKEAPPEAVEVSGEELLAKDPNK